MARIFCSLKEAADRLKKTEEELKEIIKQGKLRGFPDGPNLLLKVDEVDGLVSEERIEAAHKTLEAETPAPPALETPAPEAPKVGPPELKVKGIKVPEAETTAREAPETKSSEQHIPELETSEPQLLGLDAKDLEIPELEAPEPETAEPESPLLDTQELVVLDFEEKTVAPQAAELEILSAEKSTTIASRPEEFSADRPRLISKRRFKTKPRTTRTRSLPRLTMWQWLLKGLREDNAVAVVVFGLLLCIILSTFAVLGYVLYAILLPFTNQ